ncbi:ATP-binding protein [Zhenhengia yiwuensis]|uniref:ATP-binding protein n=1 Tax=Zhenhengia yiwuensis TaxID=2763666 RepID=UPI002A74EE73|nr:ATP-binding protein [Zhenhengia yiwuensis]MDY3366488.1 ATP-binding protein [Zhenhengia yiwuensis]
MEIMKNHQSIEIRSVLTDDIGNKWYRSDQEAPVNKPYNHRKVNGVGMFYKVKDQDGEIFESVKYGDYENVYEQKFSTSGIPSYFKDKSIEHFDGSLYNRSFDAEQALKQARNYVDAFEVFKKSGIGLYIYSNKQGSGKTLLACIIANLIMNQYGDSIKFVKAVNFFEQLKREMKNSNNEDIYHRKDTFSDAVKASVLILDDIGSEIRTDYVSTKVYELIDMRIKENKVTIFTSRKVATKLGYDDSTIMKIREYSQAIVLPDENVSERLIRNKNKKFAELLNK